MVLKRKGKTMKKARVMFATIAAIMFANADEMEPVAGEMTQQIPDAAQVVAWYVDEIKAVKVDIAAAKKDFQARKNASLKVRNSIRGKGAYVLGTIDQRKLLERRRPTKEETRLYPKGAVMTVRPKCVCSHYPDGTDQEHSENDAKGKAKICPQYLDWRKAMDEVDKTSKMIEELEPLLVEEDEAEKRIDEMIAELKELEIEFKEAKKAKAAQDAASGKSNGSGVGRQIAGAILGEMMGQSEVGRAISYGVLGKLMPQDMQMIQENMQKIPLFRGLPLGGDPGDISKYWATVATLSSMSNNGAMQIVTQQSHRELSEDCLNELKAMNQALASPEAQVQFQDPNVRRAFAVRYYHLLFFIVSYTRHMNLDWGMDGDFASSGWPDAAEYRWKANAAKLREWLGAPPLGEEPSLTVSNAQQLFGKNAPSVREVESAIRQCQNRRRDLERKVSSATYNYDSHKDNERRRIANGGTYRSSDGAISMSNLSQVHYYEDQLTACDNTLEQLENELHAAREREAKAAAKAAETKAAEARAAATPEPASDNDPSRKPNRFCTECGTKAVEGAKFCGACGHKL